MKTSIITAAAVALSLGATAPVASAQTVQATPVQFGFYLYGGRQYCFYFDGWRGPGWYWCGYAYRRGYGWGGPEGWRGWDRNGRGQHERWRGEQWRPNWGSPGRPGDRGRGDDHGRGGDRGGSGRGGDHGRGPH